ncbi:hypothetical protein [Spiribacter pallidus]|uniref:Sulfotransferase family protein n=1 Tax=Spiribacter pallidus TaxID=1987936 RepID=A0ABV3TEP8_9GAMM
MMVLHDPGIIFLKSRKTAGSSIELALSAFARDGDVIAPIDDESGDDIERARRRYPGPQHYRKSLIELVWTPTYRDLRDLIKGKPLLKFHNHCAARRARRHLGRAIWQRYLKVSVVRNPWDYMVSSYYWGNRGAAELPDFERWCLDNRRLIIRNRRQYFIGRQCVVDRFLRFEQLGQDLQVLESERPGLTGLADIFASTSAKRGIRPKTGPSVAELFDAAPRADRLVGELCRFEIERFGYQRPRRESI